EVWTNVATVPIRDGSGRVTGQVTAIHDIDAAKRAEAALRHSEERQAFLLELSDVLRPLRGSAEIQAAAVRLVAKRLGVLRAIYCEVDPDGDWVTFTANSEPGSLPTRMQLSAFG